MKTHASLRFALPLVLASLLCATNASLAQTATTSGPASAPTAIKLSPFEVNTSRDEGFVATSALAGGRLNTDLKDTPVAYSVLTKEFLDAFNITDLTQAMEWSVNTTYNPGNNVDQGFGFSPAINITIRGAAPGESNYPMRNFFPFNHNTDSYALDRFDFARGPNAILFGAAQFGGTPVSVTKQALTGKTIRQTQVQLGSWNKFRATVDVNQPINDKAAVRVAGMMDRGDTYRDNEWRRKKAVFLAGTYHLTKNTTLRAEGEYAETSQKTFPTFLTDQVSAWDGRTTYASAIAPGSTNVPTAAEQAAAGVAYATNNANPLFAPLWVMDPTAFGTGQVLNFANTLRTKGAAGNGTAANRNFIGGKAITSASVSYAGQPMIDGFEVPTGRYANALAGSPGFRIPSQSTTNLWTSKKPTQAQVAKDVSLVLSHRLGESFFFEIAGDTNKVKIDGNNAINRGANTVFIDINSTLPNGAANPNFKQPYSEFWSYQNLRNYELSSARASAAYIKETGIGRLQLALGGGANYQLQSKRSYLYLLPLQSIGPDARYWSQSQASTALWYRLYLNQAGRDFYNTDLGALALRNPDGTTTSVTPQHVLDATRKDNSADNITKFKHVMAAGNFSLFKNRLIFIGAVRRDITNLETKNTLLSGDYAPGWNGSNIVFKPAAPKDWATLTFIPKNAAGGATGPAQPADNRPRLTVPATATVAAGNILPQPQYAADRFRDDYNPPALVVASNTFSVGATFNATKWLGFYSNLATTFNPNLLVQRLDSSLLPPSASRGVDAGIRLTPLGGRVSLSLGWFTSNQNLSPVNAPGGLIGSFNTIFNTPAVGDLSPGGRNIRNEGLIPAVVRDTQTQESKGVELEVTANLTKSWRLLFNIAQTRGTQKEIAPDSRAFIVAKDTVTRQILADAGVLISSTNVATINPAVNDPTRINQGAVNNAVNAWTTLQTTTIPNLVTGAQKLAGATDYTSNLGTDYTFREGKLKGLSTGFGVHYRGKMVVGYRGADTIVNPANPLTAIDDPSVDAYTPVYSKPHTTADVRFGYSWKLADRRTLAVNLNIQNLLNNRTPIYFVNLPGGQTTNTILRNRNADVTSPAVYTVPAGFSYRTPINWTLTARLDF
ncbi:MAG: hypothetical protein CK548_03130 [Opitutia bacterium]|nr:hypothetical protein [Opitutaceae bacterium]PHX72786.1 MAG: hypothetical protein CK548_03130 [Opitutae bacterium]